MSTSETSKSREWLNSMLLNTKWFRYPLIYSSGLVYSFYILNTEFLHSDNETVHPLRITCLLKWPKPTSAPGTVIVELMQFSPVHTATDSVYSFCQMSLNMRLSLYMQKQQQQEQEQQQPVWQKQIQKQSS